jgi:CHASE1-domain containing sensor protein
VQRFLSIHDQIANVFSRRPNQDTAAKFRTARSQAFIAWARLPAWRWLAVITSADGRCSTHRASLHSIDDKLTVPEIYIECR